MSEKTVKEISKVCVIGSGTMGAAITQHFLMKGLSVTLLDLKQEFLDRGYKNISTSLDEAVKRRIISEEKKAKLLQNLVCTTSYQDIADREFVVEAVFENFKIKQDVFLEVEKNVSSDCIIASNTSSFSITELGSVMEKQERFLGVHYFFHAAKNKLIEIIPGQKTSQSTVDNLQSFYFSKDKAPIIVKDVQGFAINRFFVPWLNEAARLLEEGLGSISFIDQVAMKTFQVGMGPFALMNATGVPIAMHAAQTLADTFGPMYEPCEKLCKQVELAIDWDCESTDSPKNDEQQIKERLLAMSLGVAAQLVSEGVTDVTDTDLGARLGLRWPVGPFELMNQQGFGEIKTIVEKVFKTWDQPLPSIFNSTEPSKGFSIEHVKAHQIGNTGVIEFNRPDAMNALNEIVVAQLSACFDQLDQNSEIEKIILFGRGKAFVAGADIKFFVDNIAAKDLERIYSFTEFGQKVLAKIENSSKQTIAYLDGLALGGGLELALACQHRVATKKLFLAFPETGIGIYPGLGGTQRTTRLIGKGLAKYLIATGNGLGAEQALEYGLVDTIIQSFADLKDIAQISVDSQASPSIKDFAENAFSSFNGELSPELFKQEIFQKYQKALSRKAPLALQKAMELIEDGAELDLEEALQLEMKSLHWIFSTSDAKSGLEGIIYRKKVSFEGK
ncbi:MAG: 3-hydroxyacyl-CoA dehydrogenase [SAR324 cluster bacterium]|uniref:3-hydroxyacyl-CoA dehydrogenase n=1 Tax=SAR324 cluster bacterium TaxID=2024889 RepID=A0A2A4SRH3_9DELT|nr:MAG: 3-hydroxyacyl-CoA dehydrogenase [SAR324 cluster bacterium]